MAAKRRRRTASSGSARSAEPAAEHHALAGELVSLALVAAAVLTGLALATHDPDDASWGAETGETAVSNAVGPFGANLSLGMFEAVGVVAFLVPVTLLLLGLFVLLRRRVVFGAGRVVGAVALVLASAAMATLGLEGTHLAEGLAFPPGGFLGRVFATGMAAAIGVAGAWVVASCVVLASVLLVTRFSLRSAVEGTGTVAAAAGQATSSGAARLGTRLRASCDATAARWRDASERRRRRREERQAARAKARTARRASAPAARRAGTPAPERPTVARPRVGDRRAAGREAGRKGLLLRLRLAGDRRAEREREIDTAARGARPSPAPASVEEPAAAASSAETTVEAASHGTPDRRGATERAAAATAQRQESEFLGDAARELAASSETEAPSVGRRTTIAKAVRKSGKARDFRLPPTDLLDEAGEQQAISEEELMTCAGRIVDKCGEFGIGGQVVHIHPGPVVTTYELKPDAGIKLSRIVGLEDDLAMALKAETIRIDRIPGKSTIGIEVPNARREVISFRELAESDIFEDGASKLTMILGKTIDGAPYVADLAKMPHLLIAGSTGSGKSVCLNSIITSILYKARPEEVKLIMVDPKMLELGMYSDIPHLLTPVVTNPKLASNALKWGVKEMETRYARLAQCGVRNIEQYNAWVQRNTKDGEVPKTREGEDHEALPYIVIVIDELADLMMVAAGDVEDSICRLAQMARAVGIHLILATQRPSVDVITGVIKANLPARLAMRVASKIDSRTILDSNGAEQLLGKGDMLFLPSGSSRLLRLHGPYLSEIETASICDYLRGQLAPKYDDTVCEDPAAKEAGGGPGNHDDELFEDAARIVIERGEASTSYLQRRLKVGYSRAARLVDMLEDDGIVGPSEGSKTREVLVGPDYFDELARHRDFAGSP